MALLSVPCIPNCKLSSICSSFPQNYPNRISDMLFHRISPAKSLAKIHHSQPFKIFFFSPKKMKGSLFCIYFFVFIIYFHFSLFKFPLKSVNRKTTILYAKKKKKRVEKKVWNEDRERRRETECVEKDRHGVKKEIFK